MTSIDTASLRQLVELRDSLFAALADEPVIPNEVTLFFESGSAFAGTTEEVTAGLAARINAAHASLAKYDINKSGVIDEADVGLFEVLLDLQSWAGAEFSPLDFDGNKSSDLDDKCELLTKVGIIVPL